MSALKGAQMGNFIDANEQPPPAIITPDATADGKKKDPEPNPDYAS